MNTTNTVCAADPKRCTNETMTEAELIIKMIDDGILAPDDSSVVMYSAYTVYYADRNITCRCRKTQNETPVTFHLIVGGGLPASIPLTTDGTNPSAIITLESLCLTYNENFAIVRRQVKQRLVELYAKMLKSNPPSALVALASTRAETITAKLLFEMRPMEMDTDGENGSIVLWDLYEDEFVTVCHKHH